ncbi:hypothetical protein [Segniliparus rugosus]|uniref:DUF4878 domain-containing protein n=1 Tax=Segniliparus rugosus (strain ATCC BAA-974 / DSM 45345 / CCUG 50838 / CIP 108380 / JCM 13579 / CDC 945) TaxID=679197 RepID=E5XPH9_SEGRC|nr:hypothetical protein [Segniliparus rugosus]EFV13742.1 hypothetical protein HMPREF9336_01401 [Segniliparus rugosus ATCC BAA-974]
MSEAGQGGGTEPRLKKTKTLWAASAASAAVALLVVCGFALHVRPGPRHAEAKRTADAPVRDAVAAYVAALADGDLPKLRELTCSGYHDGFFSTVDPEQYRLAHQDETAAGDILQLDSVGAVTLTPPTAQAEAIAHFQSDPRPRRLLFSLRQSGGRWQICEPEDQHAR